ncbi:hypothetical protein SMICM17S_01116 [Streptomyces microflavus]
MPERARTCASPVSPGRSSCRHCRAPGHAARGSPGASGAGPTREQSPRTTWGSREEQVEPEPAGAQGAQREDPAAQTRTGSALPYVAGAPPDREGEGPEGDGGGGRDQEGGAEGQVQHPFGRCAGGEAVREVSGPVGEAGQACGGAGGEVASGGAGGGLGVGVRLGLRLSPGLHLLHLPHLLHLGLLCLHLRGLLHVVRLLPLGPLGLRGLGLLGLLELLGLPCLRLAPLSLLLLPLVLCRTRRCLAFRIAPARGFGVRWSGVEWCACTSRSMTFLTVSRHFVTERSHGGMVGWAVREGCGVRGCALGAGEKRDGEGCVHLS